jgi:hypothetical protein
MIHNWNPYIYDDYKLRYYQLTESLTQNNFLVTILSSFSCIPYIKGGCYITRYLFRPRGLIIDLINIVILRSCYWRGGNNEQGFFFTE